MLPAGRRVRTAEGFTLAVRGGVRAGRTTLVVHLTRSRDRSPGSVTAGNDRPAPTAQPSAAGFVVSGAVGGAVVRNRVRRRLQHLVAARLDDLPDDTSLVVRALPPSAGATSAQLAEDLDGALQTAGRRLGRTARRAGPPVVAR